MRAVINWTPEEDAILLAGRSEVWGWAKIASRLPGRTEKACASRHHFLTDAGLERAKRQDRKGTGNGRGLSRITVLPFHHPRAAEIGCAALHDATMAYLQRRRLVA